MAELAQQAVPPPQELPNAVALPSTAAKRLAATRALPHALMGGTQAMREAAEEYLPRHQAETPDDYDLRLNSTILFGVFAQTVMRQSGKFFVEPVKLNDDVPPPIVELTDNIDGQGRDITAFLVDLVAEAMVDGVSFILTDYPVVEPTATLADQRASKARPYWVLIPADRMIGWRTQNINGKQTLMQARIRETVVEPVGEFSERIVERVRVLEPGKWRLYQQERPGTSDTARWIEVGNGTTSIDYIPLTPFYINRTAYMEGEPPLRALAELALEHWQSSSEQRHALTFSRFAMLHLSGVEDAASVHVGANQVIVTPQGSSADYIEPSGSGVASGFQDLADIEKRMQSSGMELRVENAGQVTATAAAIDSTESNAALKAVARGLEDAIELALQMLADYASAGDGGTVDVYDRFGDPASVADVPALQALRSSGDLSRTTLWAELKRRNFLDEHFDPEQEAALIEVDDARHLQQAAQMTVATTPPPPAPRPARKPGGT